MKIRALEISELNRYIKNVITSNPILSRIRVRGEVSNFKRHSSGNVYLSLKDETSKINCLIFRNNYRDIGVENGSKVVCDGYIGVYERDGSYQLYIEKMEIEGIGDLYRQFLILKDKLEKEGLFGNMYKRPIPKFPKKIGVITSPTGAVIKDIINVTTRRFPKVEIILYPALVQGSNSTQSLIRGLDYFDREKNVDTIIIGRGGGSLEELWSFNDENLARRIFAMDIPVISAVGHETDFTICDFVSDMRAPTPSAAAEIATPNLEDLSSTMDMMIERMGRSLSRHIDVEKNKSFMRLDKSKTYVEKYLISQKLQDLDISLERLDDRINSRKDRLRKELDLSSVKFGSLNPFSVLDRGYSIATKEGKSIDEDSIEAGDKIELRLRSVNLDCQVLKKSRASKEII